MKNIQYPENYRFTCELEKFKKAVDITAELIKEEKVSVVFGCIDEIKVKLWIAEDEFQKCYPGINYSEYQEILETEINVILEQNLNSEILEEQSLKDYLEKNKIEEDERNRILEEKYEKRKYVQETLGESEYKKRYQFKRNTVNEKLTGFNYEINKFIFDNMEDFLYATVELESAEQLENSRMPAFLKGGCMQQKIKFVCDKEDIDFLIKVLENIREKL